VIIGVGIDVVPITSVGLDHAAPDERVSTGIDDLDEMLSGGVYRGSAVMISGSSGTGKTSIGVAIADAACARGERALFVSLEESPAQLVRNMRSIGYDLQRWIDDGLLLIQAVPPTAFGLEEHLSKLHRWLDDTSPSIVVLDAIASLVRSGGSSEAVSVISRDLDLLKSRGITTVLTTLSRGPASESSEIEISSLADTWLLLRNMEDDGERNRLMFVIKSRGTAHSNQVREFLLTGDGPQLVDVYVTDEGVLTGSARRQHMSREIPGQGQEDAS